MKEKNRMALGDRKEKRNERHGEKRKNKRGQRSN